MSGTDLNLGALGFQFEAVQTTPTAGGDDGGDDGGRSVAQPPTPRKRRSPLAFWEWVVVGAFAAGLLFIALFACTAGRTACAASAPCGVQALLGRMALLAAASWITGAFVGFLLGIPRLRTETRPPDDDRQRELQRYAPNTNLEQISDWLTKILIGATLVNLRDFANFIWSLAANASNDLHVGGAQITTASVIVFYLLLGLIWGYLWSSIRIIRALAGVPQ